MANITIFHHPQNLYNQGFDIEWEKTASDGTHSGEIKLTHVMEAAKHHPVTGEEIWFNHMNVLHVDATSSELAFSAQHL